MNRILRPENTGDPRRRFLHGETVTYLFRSTTGLQQFTIVYDSTQYSSPGEQIICENRDYFENSDQVHLIAGTIKRQPIFVKTKRMLPIQAKHYARAIDTVGLLRAN